MAKEADIMVITPHPDDAEYGVAGTVARWTKEGKKVVYVVVTNGDKGTSDPDMEPERLAEIRQKEQQAPRRGWWVTTAGSRPPAPTVPVPERSLSVISRLRRASTLS